MEKRKKETSHHRKPYTKSSKCNSAKGNKTKQTLTEDQDNERCGVCGQMYTNDEASICCDAYKSWYHR